MDTEQPTAPVPVWVPPLPHLAMMWLASPALPVGGFSYSEGLEAAVEAGVVTDEPQALYWLRGQMQLTLARSELPGACAAHAAWEAADLAALRTIQTWVLTTRETARQRLLASGGLMGHVAQATLLFAAGSPLSADQRAALLEAARAQAAQQSAAWVGATSPQPHLVQVRGVAARIEPLLHLWQNIRAAWRQTAWQLPACTPRIWRM